MFTGLVEDVGAIRRAERRGGGLILEIAPGAFDPEELAIGDSVAIDGVCLTATKRGSTTFEVLAGAETLERTTLGARRPGSRVNLERALRVGDRLGGHMVSGHVDGVARLKNRVDQGSNLVLELAVPSGLARYVIAKGSICLDGVSLTVNSISGDRLSVALIPHTREATNLGDRRVGDSLNVEVDMIGKYVERLVEAYQ